MGSIYNALESARIARGTLDMTKNIFDTIDSPDPEILGRAVEMYRKMICNVEGGLRQYVESLLGSVLPTVAEETINEELKLLYDSHRRLCEMEAFG